MVTRVGVDVGQFYKSFADAGECYRAVYDEGLTRLKRAVDEAAARETGWLGRVRAGLVAMLGFFDDEPHWARVLVLDTAATPALAPDHRRWLHDVLTHLLDGESAAAAKSSSPTPFTGELVAGGVFSVIRTSVLENDGGKLVELAPSLMAFVAMPYRGQSGGSGSTDGWPALGGEGAGATGVSRRDERARARALAQAAKLPIRATHRTTLVLRAIAHAPYSNNREVAQAAGLIDEGQASKLLARLERKGVIENVGVGAVRGEPNAWLLTTSGRRTLELLARTDEGAAAARSGAHARGLA
ncbi:MAG TPA: hypothetical protein VMB51_08155 [Solirubrobacteraceae bacterium]|nr:hypothetical protein [Solirubrobacteraceae bacterium]